jgi:hypothetical protein
VRGEVAMITSVRTERFRKWVFWTGIYDFVGFGGVACPFRLKIFLGISNGLNKALGLGGTLGALPTNVNNLLMINTLGVILVFLGILLIIASLDLEKRAWFVFWEGLIRIVFFVLSLYFILFKSVAPIVLIFGVIDLIIAIIYMYYIFTIDGLKIARP